MDCLGPPLAWSTGVSSRQSVETTIYNSVLKILESKFEERGNPSPLKQESREQLQKMGVR